MVKIARLMLEIDADEEAHRKGLTSAGWGKWADKSGKVTHRTDPETGKLVPVKGEKSSTPDQPAKIDNPAQGQAKPKHTSAQDAGVTPNNTPSAQDTQKIAKTSTPAQGTSEEKPEDNFAKTPSGEGSPMMAVKPNPHVVDLKLEMGKPVERHKVSEHFPFDPHHVLDTEIIGEDVVIASYQDRHKFFEENRPTGYYKQYESIAKAQNQWRQTLTPEERRALVQLGHIWQEESVYKASDQKKKLVNKALESICKKHRPSTKVSTPLERGMRLRVEDAKEFLKNFRIGESVDLPPSGFSMDKTYARDYARPSVWHISVLLRLAPKEDGTIYGLHLSNVDDNTKKNYTYEDEFEVVRYPGPKAKCVGVTKMVADSSQSQGGHMLPAVTYIIDLEEQGFEDETNG